MTVSAVTPSVLYQGDGLTTVFPFAFPMDETSSLEVVFVDRITQQITPVSPTDYTTTITSVGGTVTFLVAPAATDNVNIARTTDTTQLVSVAAQAAYNPQVVEAVWDKLTMLVQEALWGLGTAVKAPPGADPQTLYNDLLQAWVDAEAARDLARAWAESATAPGGVGTKSSKTHAQDAANSAAAALGSENAASGSAGAASGSAGAALTSEQNAAGSEAKASKWADEAENTPVEAGRYSAFHWTKKAEAEAQAASADRTQTGLDRIATGQDRVATGQDKTDAQTARTQAQTAQGLAEDAQGFAEAAQAAAEAAFRDFDKRYLGPYPAAPTLDLNGDPVVTGALYFDTVIGTLRVYDGSGWVTISTAGALLASANLSDVASAATSRANLGLGTAATVDHGTDLGEVPLNSDIETKFVKTADKATQPQAEGGVTGDVWMDDIRVRQAIAMWAIGVGQTWVDVMASRSGNTTYQNTTGRPIMLSVTLIGGISRSSFNLSADGTSWISSGYPGNSSSSYSTVNTVIPPGHYYRYPQSSSHISAWLELR